MASSVKKIDPVLKVLVAILALALIVAGFCITQGLPR